MTSWHSYPHIYNLGHRAVENLLTVPVIVEEKCDGSQFSFGLDENGELHVRSKGAIMFADAPEKMFARAVEAVEARREYLRLCWTYRGEYLAKPKHNALAYNRVPIGHIIIFDINTSEEIYLPYKEKQREAHRINFETVPLLAEGLLTDINVFRQLLETESILGGQKIEGVVVKPRDYNLFGEDGKVIMGKFVSEAFKEVHHGEWRKANPTHGDILDALGTAYRTPARWNKAVMHLREAGQIEDSPRDIGGLIKEVVRDVEAEAADEIKERLYAWAWPHIQRQLTHGLPEWYKSELLNKQFDKAA